MSRSSPAPASRRVVRREEAAERVAAWKAAGESVVLANGVFDLLHVGHARYLAAARALGRRLVVGVNSDLSAAALKGPGRPVMGEKDRASLVAAIRGVDLAVIFEEPGADELLRTLRPDIHAKGTDYAPDTVPERDTVRAVGGRVEIAGDPKRHASRELFERVRERHRGAP